MSYAAAFVFHTVPQLTDLDAFSWWTISDVFEEASPSQPDHTAVSVSLTHAPTGRPSPLLPRTQESTPAAPAMDGALASPPGQLVSASVACCWLFLYGRAG